VGSGCLFHRGIPQGLTSSCYHTNATQTARFLLQGGQAPRVRGALCVQVATDSGTMKVRVTEFLSYCLRKDSPFDLSSPSRAHWLFPTRLTVLHWVSLYSKGKHAIIRPGGAVLDLGCSPGAWYIPNSRHTRSICYAICTNMPFYERAICTNIQSYEHAFVRTCYGTNSVATPPSSAYSAGANSPIM
jgi:hypothetical protein